MPGGSGRLAGRNGNRCTDLFGAQVQLAAPDLIADCLRQFKRFGKGDRVIIYIAMSIDGVAAMQACARIGATHSVVFGGFSAQSLRDRIEDTGAIVKGPVPSWKRSRSEPGCSRQVFSTLETY